MSFLAIAICSLLNFVHFDAARTKFSLQARQENYSPTNSQAEHPSFYFEQPKHYPLWLSKANPFWHKAMQSEEAVSK
jgi:hypothetical protein